MYHICIQPPSFNLFFVLTAMLITFRMFVMHNVDRNQYVTKRAPDNDEASKCDYT